MNSLLQRIHENNVLKNLEVFLENGGLKVSKISRNILSMLGVHVGIKNVRVKVKIFEMSIKVSVVVEIQVLMKVTRVGFHVP